MIFYTHVIPHQCNKTKSSSTMLSWNDRSNLVNLSNSLAPTGAEACCFQNDRTCSSNVAISFSASSLLQFSSYQRVMAVRKNMLRRNTTSHKLSTHAPATDLFFDDVDSYIVDDKRDSPCEFLPNVPHRKNTRREDMARRYLGDEPCKCHIHEHHAHLLIGKSHRVPRVVLDDA